MIGWAINSWLLYLLGMVPIYALLSAADRPRLHRFVLIGLVVVWPVTVLVVVGTVIWMKFRERHP